MKPLRGFVCAVLLCGAAFSQNRPRAATDMEQPLAAEQTAEEIEVKPLYNRLRELAAHPETADRFELLDLQQQLMLKITSASLQVDASAEAVDAEIPEVKELQNYLISHRDSKVERLNVIALIIGGVGGTANSALGFTSQQCRSGCRGCWRRGGDHIVADGFACR